MVTVSRLAAAEPSATRSFPPAPSASTATSAAATLPPPKVPSPSAPAAAPPTAAQPTAPLPAAAPASYPQPYPAYAGYPPPGYTYYYPPPMAPAKPRFPDNAAAAATPFIDGLVSSVSWQNRVSQFLNVGLQAGVYVARRVRLTASMVFPTAALTDDYSPSSPGYYGNNIDYYGSAPSKAASLFYGVSVGIVAVSTMNFVMAPGVAFSRTDVSDYGSSFGVALPFEWVTANALRLGLEFDLGRAFGGSARSQCYSSTGSGPVSTCSSGPELNQDRPTGTAIVLQFQLGFGFNHPDALPAEPIPAGAPYGWPPAPLAPSPTAPPTPAPSSAPTPPAD